MNKRKCIWLFQATQSLGPTSLYPRLYVFEEWRDFFASLEHRENKIIVTGVDCSLSVQEALDAATVFVGKELRWRKEARRFSVQELYRAFEIGVIPTLSANEAIGDYANAVNVPTMSFSDGAA